MARQKPKRVEIDGPEGKQLSALLQILRAAGVTRYATKDGFVLELGSVEAQSSNPAKPAELTQHVAGTVSPLAEDDEEEPTDEEVRFALERKPLMTELVERHFPRGTDRERAIGRNGSGT